MSRVANAEAEKLVAELRARIGSEFDGELHLSEAEAIALFALIESQREDRDSWRRVAERLEEEKRAAEARVTALVRDLTSVKQQCETAVYNISQREHDAAVVRSFQNIADFSAQALSRNTEVKNDGTV